jgi:exodeoxyribonuclease-3
MAYQNKHSFIDIYQPDIKVIQECSKSSLIEENHLWFGDTPSKGIGITFKEDARFSLAPYFVPLFKWVIPIEVAAQDKYFTLIAIWLKNDKKYAYAGHFIQAMNYYLPLIKNKNVIIIGDFNSNSIWDKKHRHQGNHRSLVNMLENEEIISAYHKYYNEEQGQETRFTHFYRRKTSALFHIDYCFISQGVYSNIVSYEVGQVSDWIDKSDHAPLILTLRDL